MIVGSRRFNLAAVSQYYSETYIDYCSLWLNRKNLAFHFGCYDPPSLTHSESLERSNALLADIAEVRDTDHVLDAGCGLGGSSCWLARERGASATGVALGSSQMSKAARLAREKGLEGKVRFLCADFIRTPFPDASFDVVWAQESLCHAPDKPSFYREASRLLRPGGRIVIAEFMRTPREASTEDELVLGEWLSGWAIPSIATAAEHADAAVAAGFSRVSVRDVTPCIRPSLRRLYRWSRAAWHLEHVLHRLRMRTDVQHGNIVAARRQWEALVRGLWVYGIVSGVQA